MNLQTLETLRSARALVARGWTQQAMARDAHGVQLIGGNIHPDGHETATPCAWCAWGAICAAAPEGDARETAKDAAREALRDAVGGWSSVGGWNDKPERTQAEVLAAFDCAILKGERDMLRAALVESADYLAEFFEEGRAHRVIRAADAALAAIPQT